MQAPARKTEVPQIAANPPSLQPTAQTTDILMVATKAPDHQHTILGVLTNQSAKSNNATFLTVQCDVPQP